MAQFSLPEPGRPLVLVARTGEASILDVDCDTLLALYKAHGALLLRGFDADLARFGAFARQFCSTAVVNETPGRAPLDPENSIYSVSDGSNEFALHPELARQPWKPDVAMFACLEPPGEGGMTTICDGIALARALPDVVRQGLEGRRLIYLKGTWPEMLEFWLGTAEPDDALLRQPPAYCPFQFMRVPDGRIACHFSRPALHKPMFAEDLAFGNFLLFARFNNGRTNFPLLDDMRAVPEEWLQAIKATGDRLALAVQWQKGDVMMIDNTRFLHGRTAFDGDSDRLIATYFGYLDCAIPDPEEPEVPIWRYGDFMPPFPPDYMIRRT